MRLFDVNPDACGKAGGFSAGVLALALGLAMAPGALAQAPTAGPTSRPVLEELNRETEGLYKEASASLVRVQLPRPHWMNDYAMAPMNRWDKLDPQVRKRLEQQSANLAQQNSANGGFRLAMRPATATPPNAGGTAGPVTPPHLPTQGHALPATSPAVNLNAPGTIVFVPAQVQNNSEAQDAQLQQRDAVLGARLSSDVSATTFTPNNIGVLLDDAGHVLVPLYIERETVGQAPVKVALSDGRVLDAKFVGSDRQTNLTLLEVEHSGGTPIKLTAHKPIDGSLVVTISPTDGAGRLGLWSGGKHEYGIIITLDGGMAGIARYGQFLSGSACHLIAEQLIRYGSVKRATLGVIISEIRQDDPLRGQLPVLGTRTAMRIDEVIPGSIAEKAGLKAGDLLLALAGEAVSDIPSFAAAIAARSGATELQVLRGSAVLKLNVVLAPQK